MTAWPSAPSSTVTDPYASHHYHFLSLAPKGLLLLPHLILTTFSPPSSQDLIDYEKLTSEDKLGNLNLAFDVALRHLGVPRILDAEDIANMPRPDERSVMTYVAQLYNVFASMDKVEHAGRRLGKVRRSPLQRDFESLVRCYIVTHCWPSQLANINMPNMCAVRQLLEADR